jgi:hypothetical protein
LLAVALVADELDMRKNKRMREERQGKREAGGGVGDNVRGYHVEGGGGNGGSRGRCGR